MTEEDIEQAIRNAKKETLLIIGCVIEQKIDQAKSEHRDLSLREIAEEIKNRAKII